ncbi:sigma-E factor negative regulatory protein [Marinobacter sp. CHS3-4]|uniref:sigma-E factor negative regulatory protein n=1 Tax=Marinobacter sp. CHS3-4 TaxID=3045174 RepID=UPI0024B4DE36|nr:sigma-E factor negative regulatory protein [Marinobacter sp. CHS3-4]MDI9246127.1 sigma-E factor negative regulatory protein [Marinobacter sp. CHS3-4]
MDDRLKETLSAMMDDEADELSVRRLLSHENQDEVRGQFHRWQQMRDLIQRGHPTVDSVDVSEGVRDLLDGHVRVADPQAGMSSPARRKLQWSAVATVALALAVGFGAGTGWDSATETLPTEQAASAGIPELPLNGLDEQQREQLSRYLLQHAQHNSVGTGHASMGYARAVSASGAGY